MKTRTKFDAPIYYFLIASGLLGLSNGLFDAVYNFLLQSKGIDKSQTGNIYAIALTMMSLAVVPLVIINKKHPTKKLLIWSSVLYCIPFAIIPFCDTVASNALILGLILAGSIGMLSTGNAIFGTYVAVEKRTQFFSYFFVSYLSMAMIGSFMAGIINKIKFFEEINNYIFIILLGFLFSIGLVFFRIKSIQRLPEQIIEQIEKEDKKPIEWLNFILLILAASLLGGSITLVFRFANLIFEQAFELNVANIANILGLDKAISIVGALFAPILVKKMPTKKAILLLGTTTALVLFAQAQQMALYLFLVLYLLRLLLNYALMPLLDNMTITYFSNDRTLLSSSIRQAFFYLGSAGASIVYGYLLQQENWPMTFIYAAAMTFFGSIALLLMKKA